MEGRSWRVPGSLLEGCEGQGVLSPLTGVGGCSLCPCITLLGESSLGFQGDSNVVPSSQSSWSWFMENSGLRGPEVSLSWGLLGWEERGPSPER